MTNNPDKDDIELQAAGNADSNQEIETHINSDLLDELLQMI